MIDSYNEWCVILIDLHFNIYLFILGKGKKICSQNAYKCQIQILKNMHDNALIFILKQLNFFHMWGGQGDIDPGLPTTSTQP